MSSGYVIPIDPAELANRFSAPPDLLENEAEEADEGEALFSGEDFENRIAPLLERIPQREADLIYLYYIQKKRQADIAEIFEVTQAAISYRLDRGLQRIKFLLSIPHVTEEEMREDLADAFQQIDVNILVGMWQTTCQSEVAATLGLTQGRVRHRFFKSVGTLKDLAAACEGCERCEEDHDDDNECEVFQPNKYEPYSRIFSAISSKKFNILREVKLPQWAGRGGDTCA